MKKKEKINGVPEEVAKQLHRKVIKKFRRRRIVTKGIDDIWAADLLIMSKYGKENDNNKYILVVIDTFSKFLWTCPLKTKTGIEVSQAFAKLLKKSSPRKPRMLHVDRGKEFVNKDFRAFLKKYVITMYHTYNEEKSAIAERVNRTLNDMLRVHFSVTGAKRWVHALPMLTKKYNEEKLHRTIGTYPANVTKKNELEIMQRIYNLRDFRLTKPTFEIGDAVRITTKKATFADKYSANWTREKFKIKAVFLTDPITYSLIDDTGEEILGKFYKEELQKI